MPSGSPRSLTTAIRPVAGCRGAPPRRTPRSPVTCSTSCSRVVPSRKRRSAEGQGTSVRHRRAARRRGAARTTRSGGRRTARRARPRRRCARGSPRRRRAPRRLAGRVVAGTPDATGPALRRLRCRAAGRGLETIGPFAPRNDWHHGAARIGARRCARALWTRRCELGVGRSASRMPRKPHKWSATCEWPEGLVRPVHLYPAVPEVRPAAQPGARPGGRPPGSLRAVGRRRVGARAAHPGAVCPGPRAAPSLGGPACRSRGEFFDGLLPGRATQLPVPIATGGPYIRGDDRIRVVRDGSRTRTSSPTASRAPRRRAGSSTP